MTRLDDLRAGIALLEEARARLELEVKAAQAAIDQIHGTFQRHLVNRRRRLAAVEADLAAQRKELERVSRL